MAVRDALAQMNKAEKREFLNRLAEAERRKIALRRPYALSAAARERSVAKADFEAWKSSSISFWSEIQAINEDLLPEDPVYSGTRGGVTLATTTDLWTLTSPASGQARILESFIGGEATSSTVVRVALQRSTSGTTATNQTPELFSTRSPAAVGTFATTWSVQPTLSGNPLLSQTFNAFGGGDRWVAQPGEEIYLVNGEKFSCRSASGIPVVSAHVVFEEL